MGARSANVSGVYIKENGYVGSSGHFDATAEYFDHQPGDGTRYEILAIDLGDRAVHLGRLGYVSDGAIAIICGMGDGRAYLFHQGDDVSEFYIKEKFGLANPHTVHHITELVAAAINGRVVGCEHEGAVAHASP